MSRAYPSSSVHDVVVIGGGGAGMAAAIAARASGAQVALVTKFALGASNTSKAQGGIQAAVGDDDSLETHAEDTFRAGHERGRRDLIDALVAGGPAAVEFLVARGVAFTREGGDNRSDAGGRAARAGGTAVAERPTALGAFRLVRSGGTTRARLLQAGDATGAAIVKALRPEAAACDVHDYAAVEAIERAGERWRVLARHKDGEPVRLEAPALVVAAGGRCARVAAERGTASTNHPGATGEVTDLLLALGARARELDSLQPHPTGGVWPEKVRGFAVPETARSWGAVLRNADGDEFVDPLAPRDVVAAAVEAELAAGRGVAHPDDADAMSGVWLDCTPIDREHGEGFLAANIPHAHRRYAASGVDLAREPVLVRPILHYQNGGVEVDVETAVLGLDGVFAAGEVTGGLHGTNRLMGNSLLDVVVNGRRAGAAAARRARG